ncbi:MFS transporter [Kineobactrum salinum]|uniref:MFS transporter n=1 Tax=Kineobactrum salinum TaxID=2708301 RepID=A0A6C0TZL9_9GAMM|nr:MFS transporter [Kineobactrum salinum]QIB64147.1 MFS transporter [Kineobactrum salinum]
MNQALHAKQASSFQGLESLAYILVGTVGVGVFLCMPVISSALAENFGFDARQVGEFSFVQLAFISLGCLAGLYFSRRFSMRSVAAASVGLLLLMDLVSPHLREYNLFLVARAVAGMAGGVAMALATGALARLPAAEKYFGLFLLSQIIFSVVGIWLMPRLVASFGIAGVFYPLALVELVVIPLALLSMPARSFAEGPSSVARNSTADWMLSAVMLVAILTFFTAVGAYWTYVGMIGRGSGLSAESVGLALSLAAVGGALGSLVPVVVQQRFGQIVPLAGAAACLLLALALTNDHDSLFTFALSAAIFMFGWYIFHPYQLGVLAAIDRDGRAMMASAALTGLGLSIGPALVSRFIDDDMSVVYWISGAAFAVALGLILGAMAFATSGKSSAGAPCINKK